MKKTIFFLSLVFAAWLINGCAQTAQQNSDTDEVQDHEFGETTPAIWWYDVVQDVFYDVDTVKQDTTITVNLPKECKLFYLSDYPVINVVVRCERAEIPELSYFTAYGFDENDLHLANDRDWRNWAAGDNILTGDFVLTLWYGKHRVTINGKVR